MKDLFIFPLGQDSPFAYSSEK